MAMVGNYVTYDRVWNYILIEMEVLRSMRECFIAGIDFAVENGMSVLTISRFRGSEIVSVKQFAGEEAERLYAKLISVEKEVEE